jgi:hypothetical protein
MQGYRDTIGLEWAEEAPAGEGGDTDGVGTVDVARHQAGERGEGGCWGFGEGQLWGISGADR